MTVLNKRVESSIRCPSNQRACHRWTTRPAWRSSKGLENGPSAGDFLGNIPLVWSRRSLCCGCDAPGETKQQIRWLSMRWVLQRFSISYSRFDALHSASRKDA